MADIKKQFSLDYMIPGAPSSTRGADVGARALDEAVILYSQPILQFLENAPRQQMPAHDLAKLVSKGKPGLDFNFESFIEVINHLERLGFVNIAERDVTGNHLIRLLRTP
jgi:hypothetical protein